MFYGDLMGTCPNSGAYVSAGTNVCSCETTFASYSPKEEKRKHDNVNYSSAIAVYLESEKIGYVANSNCTACHLTLKVSEIKIMDGAYAEYLLHYGYRYHIAKIN